MAKKIMSPDTIIKNLKGFSLSSARVKDSGNIPTGHFALDFVIHYGMDPANIDLSSLENYDPSKALGIPCGYIVEIFGEEGGGKSSLAHRVCGYAQRMGHTAAWIDAEHSFQENLAMLNGVSIDDLIYPDKTLSAEQIIDLIVFLCDTDKVPMRKNNKDSFVDPPKVIVVDSIASLTPQARADSMSEQQFMGLLARLLSDNLGKVAGAVERNGVLLILINQIREKIGMTWGNPIVSPGGHALKHFFSLRLKLTKKGGKESNIYREDEETGEDVLIGRRTNVRFEKNRFAKPFLDNLEIPIYYEKYFPEIGDIAFDTGRQIKLITVRKGVYSWNDIKIQGKKDFIAYVEKNNLLSDLIINIKEKAKENEILLPPELNKYEIEGENNKDEKVQTSRPKEDSGVVEKKSQKRGRPKSTSSSEE